MPERAKLRAAEALPTTALAELNELLWALPASLDPQEIVAVLLERCTRLFRAPLAALWLREGHSYAPAGVFGFTEKKAEQLWQRLELDHASPNSVQLDGPALHLLGGFGKRRLGSLTAVPLRASRGIAGWFVFARLEPEPFSDLERSFLEILANRVAIALDNARQYQETRSRSRELELLNDVAGLLASTTRLDELLERLGAGMLDTMGLSSCFVYLLEGEGPIMRPATIHHRDPEMRAKLQVDLAHRPLTTEQGRSAEIYRHRTPILVSNLAEETIVPKDILAMLGPGSLLILPLSAQGTFLGAMYLVRSARHAPLDETMLPLATTLASQVSVAIANARMFEALEGKVAERTADIQKVYGVLAERFNSGREYFAGLASTLQGQLAELDSALEGKGDVPHARAVAARLAADLGKLFDKLEASRDVRF